MTSNECLLIVLLAIALCITAEGGVIGDTTHSMKQSHKTAGEALDHEAVHRAIAEDARIAAASRNAKLFVDPNDSIGNNDEEPMLGESMTSTTTSSMAATSSSSAEDGSNEAYIPLFATLPNLNIDNRLILSHPINPPAAADKQKFTDMFPLMVGQPKLLVTSDTWRQVSLGGFLDLSGVSTGVGIIGANFHLKMVDNVNTFTYSNTHSAMSAVGLATNYPTINKMSFIASSESSSRKNVAFAPTVVATITATGEFGLGSASPPAKFTIISGTQRAMTVNHWADISGSDSSSSGVGLFGGNTYVATESNAPIFRYSNSHSAISAIGIATNYPAANKLTIVGSSASGSKRDDKYIPINIATFSVNGNGFGTASPVAILDVRGINRQIVAAGTEDGFVGIEMSSQANYGVVGSNLYLERQDDGVVARFSVTSSSSGSVAMATNYPQMGTIAMIASQEKSSKKYDIFKPLILATFTQTGMGIFTSDPAGSLDIRGSGRSLIINSWVEMSSQKGSTGFVGFLGSNAYVSGAGDKTSFRYGNTHDIVGAIGFATHYPLVNQASIIATDISKTGKPSKDAGFEPYALVSFNVPYESTRPDLPNVAMHVNTSMIVEGDILLKGEMQSDEPISMISLIQENRGLKDRLSKLEMLMATLTTSMDL